jgi:hypothetical protein
MAPDARPFLDQVNPKTGRGKVKGRLNTADPAPHNHYVSKIIAFKIPGKLLNDFLWQYIVIHFMSPLYINPTQDEAF